MSATNRGSVRPTVHRAILLLAGLGAAGTAGAVIAARTAAVPNGRVKMLLAGRLPRTNVTRIDCGAVYGLCEVTAGSNLFYVDRSARYLVIGRVYDMQTRQDLTAARLLEINPDLLVGGAAKANASEAAADARSPARPPGLGQPVRRAALPARSQTLPLSELPRDGAIVWGNHSGTTVTVFTDFRCTYCRAVANVLRELSVRVVERPISVLGSRDLADRVYCAKDREAALRAAYAGEPLARTAGHCDTSGLDANERFARQHGLTATPVIVRGDGAVLEGFRTREFLEDWLRGARS